MLTIATPIAISAMPFQTVREKGNKGAHLLPVVQRVMQNLHGSTGKSMFNKGLQSWSFVFTPPGTNKCYYIWKALSSKHLIAENVLEECLNAFQINTVSNEEHGAIVELLNAIAHGEIELTGDMFSSFNEWTQAGKRITGGRVSLTKLTRIAHAKGDLKNYMNLDDSHKSEFLKAMQVLNAHVDVEVSSNHVDGVDENMLKGIKTHPLVQQRAMASIVPDLLLGYREGFNDVALSDLIFNIVLKATSSDTPPEEVNLTQYKHICAMLKGRLGRYITYVKSTKKFYYSVVDDYGKLKIISESLNNLSAAWKMITVCTVATENMTSRKSLADVTASNDWFKICRDVDMIPFRSDIFSTFSTTQVLNIYSPVPYILGGNDTWKNMLKALFVADNPEPMTFEDVDYFRKRYPASMFPPNDQSLFSPVSIQEHIRCAHKHVKEKMCGGDMDKFVFFCNFMLIPFTNPGYRTDRCIILRGKEGVGKSQFFIAMDNLLGDKMTITSKIWDIKSSGFNAAEMGGKLMLVLDEFYFKGRVGGAEELNNMITEHVTRINAKNEPVRYEQNSRNHVIITNKDKFVLPGNSEMRRWVFFNVDNTMRISKDLKAEYFNRLSTCYNCKFFMLLLLETFMLEYDENYNFSQTIQSSEAMLKGQMMNYSPLHAEKIILEALNTLCNGNDQMSTVKKPHQVEGDDRRTMMIDVPINYVIVQDEETTQKYNTLAAGVSVKTSTAKWASFNVTVNTPAPTDITIDTLDISKYRKSPLYIDWSRIRPRTHDMGDRDAHTFKELGLLADGSSIFDTKLMRTRAQTNEFRLDDIGDSVTMNAVIWPTYDMLYIMTDFHHPHGSLTYLYLGDIYPVISATPDTERKLGQLDPDTWFTDIYGDDAPLEPIPSFTWAAFLHWFDSFKTFYEGRYDDDIGLLKYLFCGFFCRRYPLHVPKDPLGHKYAVICTVKNHFIELGNIDWFSHYCGLPEYKCDIVDWFECLDEWMEDTLNRATKRKREEDEAREFVKRRRIEPGSDSESSDESSI